jgi:hypothetical protein
MQHLPFVRSPPERRRPKTCLPAVAWKAKEGHLKPDLYQTIAEFFKNFAVKFTGLDILLNEF